MLTREAAAKRDQQRECARAYWQGAQDQPLVLQHGDGFCVCDVLSPTRWSQVRAGLRCLCMYVINWIPFSSLKIPLLRLMGVRIGRDVYISPGVVIDPIYPWLVELDDDVLLGMGCRLLTHEYTAAHFRVGRIHVGRGSVIGAYSTVRSGVTIGGKATVGFNSLVNKDVPDGITVGGVPARPLRSREEMAGCS